MPTMNIAASARLWNKKPADVAGFSSEDDRDETMYLCNHAVQAIQLWKCHQISSVRQDQCGLDVLRQLSEETCLITNDWLIKFLPQKYRETRFDWFGKRGNLMTYQCGFSTSEWLAPVTVLYPHSTIQQPGSSVVTHILEHALRTLKTEYFQI